MPKRGRRKKTDAEKKAQYDAMCEAGKRGAERSALATRHANMKISLKPIPSLEKDLDE